jgi:hypothetical protein
MPKKLTDAEEAIVAKASQDLHRYERICKEHSAILRRDTEGCDKAYQEYAANSNGFVPPPFNELDHHIEESEKVLKKECRTLLEYAAYKFDGSDSANLPLFSVATFMWYTLRTFSAGSC